MMGDDFVMPEGCDNLPYNFRARLQLYEMTERTRGALRALWPIVAPALDEAIESFIEAELRMPTVASIFQAHGAEIGRLEHAHMRLLLSGQIDERYARSCRELNAWEATIGLTPRTRIFGGTLILRAALDALARKSRLSGKSVAEGGKVLSQAIAFDVATSFTLFQDAEANAAEMRRARITGAIGEFEPILRTLVDCVRSASEALQSQSTGLARGADSTSERMEVASRSSALMTHTIESTSQSANELSARSPRSAAKAPQASPSPKEPPGRRRRRWTTSAALRRRARRSGPSSTSFRASPGKPTCWL